MNDRFRHRARLSRTTAVGRTDPLAARYPKWRLTRLCGRWLTTRRRRAGMDVGQTVAHRDIVGGVDTHKDLHVAAVVDELDRVLESRCFATTRHGYKQML